MFYILKTCNYVSFLDVLKIYYKIEPTELAMHVCKIGCENNFLKLMCHR